MFSFPRQIPKQDNLRAHLAAGYSLVELMVTVAILSIVAAIALPLYSGYILEGHLATMRTTADGLRVVLEDFRLENGNYGATGNLVGLAAIARPTGRYDWEPSGDLSVYTYTVSVTGTNSYDVWGVFNADTTAWMRCDNRFTNCCYPDTAGATAVTSACP